MLVDWAYMGWLADGPKTGRVFRLRYNGGVKSDYEVPIRTDDISGFLFALDHPALSIRRENQRKLSTRPMFIPLPCRATE